MLHPLARRELPRKKTASNSAHSATFRAFWQTEGSAEAHPEVPQRLQKSRTRFAADLGLLGLSRQERSHPSRETETQLQVLLCLHKQIQLRAEVPLLLQSFRKRPNHAQHTAV